MFRFYANEYGVRVEVLEDQPDNDSPHVKVHADGAVFYDGPCWELAKIMAIPLPINVNPGLLQFAQWYDENKGDAL